MTDTETEPTVPKHRGSNTLLVGASGSGKTYSVRTFIDAGITTLVLFTEPSEVLDDISCEQGLHTHYVGPAEPDWDAMLDSADKINKLSFKALTSLTDINKGEYAQFLEVIRTLGNYKCERCGKEFGPVDKLDSTYAIVVDSLSGLNIMAMDLVVGSKPVKSMGDWGVAMDNLERIITKLCSSTSAWFVLTAHLERQVDEVLGSTQLMVSVLGKKLATRVPRFFSDVILCKRNGKEFSWDTAEMNVDLKARNLPIQSGITPDFKQIVDTVRNRWKKDEG